MAEETMDPASADHLDMFDPEPGVGLACRVCGALVAARDQFPKAHWDWHEASNGA